MGDTGNGFNPRVRPTHISEYANADIKRPKTSANNTSKHGKIPILLLRQNTGGTTKSFEQRAKIKIDLNRSGNSLGNKNKNGVNDSLQNTSYYSKANKVNTSQTPSTAYQDVDARYPMASLNKIQRPRSFVKNMRQHARLKHSIDETDIRKQFGYSSNSPSSSSKGSTAFYY